MRDEDDTGREVVEEPLEPREAGEVEVVGRLVEQEDVEARQQDSRQRGAGRLAAGEARHLALGARAEPDVAQDGAGARLEVLAAEREEAVEGIAVGDGELGLLAEPARQLVHRVLRGADAGAPSEVGEHRLALAGLRLLRQQADGAAAHDLAAIGLLEPRQHPQQGRFADPVRADDPYAVARRDDQRDAVEHLDGGVALRDVTCSE